LNSSKERTERVEIFWLLDRMDFKRIQGTSWSGNQISLQLCEVTWQQFQQFSLSLVVESWSEFAWTHGKQQKNSQTIRNISVKWWHGKSFFIS
jgi:hypothetical protein